MKLATGFIRIILTIVLLVIVFRNAHWSVGLSIRGLAFCNEVTVFLLARKITPYKETKFELKGPYVPPKDREIRVVPR